MATATRHPIIEAILNIFSPKRLQRPNDIKKTSPSTALPKVSKLLQKETQVIHISAKTASPQRPPPNGHANGISREPHHPDENNLSTSLGTDIHTGQEVYISHQERLQILSLFGATGAGKTTLFKNLILSNIQNGQGVCVLDPHGDLIRAVIAGIPERLLEKVILLDVTEADFPVALNLLETPHPRTIRSLALCASSLTHIFSKIWGLGPETPRLLMVLRAVTRTLLENPGATIAEAGLLFTSDSVRAKMVSNLTNQEIIAFWEGFSRRTQREKDELTASCANKISAFLDEPMIKHIVGQSKSSLDFRRIMDSGQILLVSLSPQFEEASNLLGSVLVSRILLAAFSRADLPESKRRQFYLYADEWHRYATPDFATLLSEARKFALATTLATQTLEQLDDANRAAALQSGSLVTFRVSGDDSKVLARSYDATPTSEIVVGEERPIRAPVADPLSHLVRHGHPHPAVAKLVSDYLLPLEALSSYIANMLGHPLWIGPLSIRQIHVTQARGLLNATLATCIREGKADLFLPPLILFILGAAAGTGIPDVFDLHFKRSFLEYGEFVGFHKSANQFGDPAYLANQKAITAIVQTYAKKRVSSNGQKLWQTPGPTFIEMLTLLRQTMEVLAKEPLLTDTGLYQPKYQLRSYQDQKNMVANELSQLPNYTAKVKLLSGEHTIRTYPAPKLCSEAEIDERISAIKQRMLFLRITKPYREVQRDIQLRQQMLRERADADVPPPPPSHTTGRRNGRQKPPPTHT
jgi:hypothetical protein